jgi:hypothetical protein
VAWAHVKDSPGAGGVASASAATLNVGAFGSAVTLNNYVVAWAWGGNSSTPPTAGQVTCTDNGATPNTYTQIAFKGQALGANPGTWAAAFVAKVTSNPASGNLNPKVSNSGSGPWIVGCAAEFSGGTTTTDGSSTNGSTNNTSNAPTCGNMTTAVADDLLVAAFGMNQTSDLSTIADPTNYTLVGKTVSETVEAGAGHYRIVTGTVTNNNPAWALTGASSAASDGWAACQAALQPAAGAASPVLQDLMHRPGFMPLLCM